jgi:peptidase E
MTTYILHGGMTSRKTADNDCFFRQFTSLVDKQTVEILFCYFARKREEWEALFERDQTAVRNNCDRDAELIMVEKVNDIYKKIIYADVIYFAGGEQEYLAPFIPDLRSLKESLDGKIYIGSSMGAFLASQNYVLSYDRQDTAHVYQGLGLVPFNTLCHWNVETMKQEKINFLKEVDPEKPVILLDEEKYITFIN